MRSSPRDEAKTSEGGGKRGRIHGQEGVEEGKSFRYPETMEIDAQFGKVREEAAGKKHREGGGR